MSRSPFAWIRSDLSILYESTKQLKGWDVELTKEFIEEGESNLALDNIAFAYLKNEAIMAEDNLIIFEKLADFLETEKDPEYDAVARFRARHKAKSP